MKTYLTYHCEKCGEEIKDGKGGIAVSYTDIAEHQKLMREFKDAHTAIGPDGERFGTVFSLREAGAIPETAHWYTAHWACIPEVQNPYDIGAEDIRTFPALLDWIAHLLGKNWIQDTDFGQLLRARVKESAK